MEYIARPSVTFRLIFQYPVTHTRTHAHTHKYALVRSSSLNQAMYHMSAGI